MKSKIFAIILSALILLSAMPALADNTLNDAYAKEAIAHLVNLGALPATFSGDGYMTRGQFAEAVYKLSGDSLAPVSDCSYYDLSANHPNYDAVQYCVMMSYMNGYQGYIRPDDGITYMEAITVIIRMLQYTDYATYHGGYPLGYYVTANNLGILKNTTITQSDNYLGNLSAATLLFNTMLCYMNEMVTIAPDYHSFKPGTTQFLYEKLALKYATGIMTSNGYTDVRGNAQLGGSTVSIDGYSLTLADAASDCRFLLGQSVSVLYDNNNRVFSIAPRAALNNTLEITQSEFEKKNGQAIDYYRDGEVHSAHLSGETLYFLNGSGTYDLESTGFATAAYSDMHLVDNNGDFVYDYVFVNTYTTFPVYSVGTDEVVSSLTGSTTIDFDCGKDVGIYNVRGEKIDLDAVRSGMVMSAIESDRFIYAIVYDGMASGELKEIGENYITLNSLNINVPNGTSSFFGTLPPGTFIDAYFDFQGRLVCVKEGFDTGDRTHYGYLLDSGISSGLNRSIKLKVFSNNRKMEVLELAERFSVDGVWYKTSELSSVPVCFMSNGALRNEIILYEFNSEDKVISIDFAAETLSEGEDGLIRVFSGKTFSVATTGVAAISNTDNAEFLDGDTRIFVIPEDLKNEAAYDIMFLSEITASGTFVMDTYHFNKNSAFVDIAVIHGSANPVHTTNTMSVVISVSEGIDEDGNDRVRLVYFDKTKEYTAYATDEAIISELKNCQPGDTVRMSISSDGIIKNIRKVYDYSTDTLTTDSNTTITSSGSISSSVYTDSNDSLYCAKAYVVYADGKMIRVDDTYRPYNTSDIFLLRGFLLSSAKVMNVKKTTDGITVTAGTASDINVGDKIVFMSRSTKAYHVAIYK